jgi:glycosyltransferase involved in cell wall biosynthesis
MRIAQVAPLAEAVPPRLYGGTERIVSYLTEELVVLGHDVTLFASGDSRTAAKLVPVVPRALRLNLATRDPVASHVHLVQSVLSHAAEFDVIHFHIDHYHLPACAAVRLPYLTTMHGRLDLPELPALFRAFPNAALVAISANQRMSLPEANFIGTVHHGLPASLLRPTVWHQGYLAFLGRVCPDKGLDRAIRIACRAGMPLRIAAKVDRADESYFRESIQPLLSGPGVEFVGEIGQDRMAEFLGGAAALLFPIGWPEPFGLVMIEAMACGTPVVAFDHGSVREIVDDGASGFIVRDEEQAVAALAQIPMLDRQRIRLSFEQRFTSRRMANDYLRLYTRLARVVAGPSATQNAAVMATQIEPLTDRNEVGCGEQAA